MKKSIIQEFYAFMIGIEILLDHFASTADGGSQQFLPAHNYDRCKAILHYLAQHESGVTPYLSGYPTVNQDLAAQTEAWLQGKTEYVDVINRQYPNPKPISLKPKGNAVGPVGDDDILPLEEAKKIQPGRFFLTMTEVLREHIQFMFSEQIIFHEERIADDKKDAVLALRERVHTAEQKEQELPFPALIPSPLRPKEILLNSLIAELHIFREWFVEAHRLNPIQEETPTPITPEDQ